MKPKFNFKSFFIERTKKFFAPLKSKWFWIIVIPLSILATYLEYLGYIH